MSRADTARTRRISARFLLVIALVAVVLALLVMRPFSHWVYEPRMIPYLVPWLLDPRTGFLSLTLVLWALVAVPYLLRAMAARGIARRSLREARSALSSPTRRGTSAAEDGVEGAQDQVSIPAVSLEEMGPVHRVEMAEALGIPWDDSLVLDDGAWARACRDAARERAAARRR
ncbi:hypothetical protein [Brachybacterium saurashtrense]|uniref:Uncharacterized protein n=1 Tax=Brachybacterium saurashtrense TaxID=556288 RepID=A0A345YKJ6_9MICO|nr:hypothetical protein [Brachybacterium saurashtrense]AXK44448.1 hypothetical protein DWV08_01635 [Brachybacterium saurashtrense]RRR23060.1 hypothetical protein DXU92_06765 [Brachybacterium saurashtrense]